MAEIKKRHKIDCGIYRDQWGIAVIVNVGPLRREERFPLETNIKTLKARRDEMRVALRKIVPTAGAARSQPTQSAISAL